MAVFTFLEEYGHSPGGFTGLFGASTGAASALSAAAQLGERVFAVVSRGGRPDLVMDQLPLVKSPVLLLVGERDEQVLELNRKAFNALLCEKHLEVIPSATHLFEEPGTLEQIAALAASWFDAHCVQNKKSDAF
jgi:pimeloyl-ACP methyl ester carboxylesterase